MPTLSRDDLKKMRITQIGLNDLIIISIEEEILMSISLNNNDLHGFGSICVVYPFDTHENIELIATYLKENFIWKYPEIW